MSLNGEVKLYYLYMIADGYITEDERKMFDDICKDFSIGEELKNDLVEACEELIAQNDDIYELIISEKIDEEAKPDTYYLSERSKLGSIIWNLVNLGYADKSYSESEKKIVNYLVEKWGLKKEVYYEMVDTADTMLSLVKQKEWVKKNLKKKGESKINEIEDNISRLHSDIKLTIEELGMTIWPESFLEED